MVILTCFKVASVTVMMQVKLNRLYTLSFSSVCLVAEAGGKLSRAVYLAPPPPPGYCELNFFHAHFTCFKYLNIKLIPL